MISWFFTTFSVFYCIHLGIAKADMPKFMPPEPENDTDVEATIEQVKKNDSGLKELNWNNIRVCQWVLLLLKAYIIIVWCRKIPILRVSDLLLYVATVFKRNFESMNKFVVFSFKDNNHKGLSSALPI